MCWFFVGIIVHGLGGLTSLSDSENMAPWLLLTANVSAGKAISWIERKGDHQHTYCVVYSFIMLAEAERSNSRSCCAARAIRVIVLSWLPTKSPQVTVTIQVPISSWRCQSYSGLIKRSTKLASKISIIQHERLTSVSEVFSPLIYSSGTLDSGAI